MGVPVLDDRQEARVTGRADGRGADIASTTRTNLDAERMEKSMGYFVEWNGEYWQSVFPANEAEKSQLHTSMADAYDYMTDECGVDPELIERKAASRVNLT